MVGEHPNLVRNYIRYTTWTISDFRPIRSVEADIITKTVTTLMYMDDFT